MARPKKDAADTAVPGELRWKIKQARTEHRPALNRREVGGRTGVGDSTVGAYEAGGRTIPRQWVSRLADSLGVSLEWFFDGKPTPPQFSNVSVTPPKPGLSSNVEKATKQGKHHLNLVPYWGAVPAGNWDSPPSDPDWIQVSEEVDTEGVIAVRVTGPSMEPRLLHGQLVSIKLDPDPKDGVISLITNQDGELALKVPQYAPGKGWIFMSINPAHDPLTAEMVKTLGYAISLEETNKHGIRP